MKRALVVAIAALLGATYGAMHMRLTNERNNHDELALAYGCGFLEGSITVRNKIVHLQEMTPTERFDCPWYRAVAIEHGLLLAEFEK